MWKEITEAMVAMFHPKEGEMTAKQIKRYTSQRGNQSPAG